MFEILHNPRCGKSRNCLAVVKEKGKEIVIINYLIKPLSELEVKTLLKKLNYKPLELVRQKESIWTDNFQGKPLSDDDIIKALAKFPILIERPIVIHHEQAIVARDIEKLKNFI